jgi:hypothetical protein
LQQEQKLDEMLPISYSEDVIAISIEYTIMKWSVCGYAVRDSNQ